MSYTVPVAPDQYIQIMIIDKKLINELEGFDHGEGKTSTFQGEIIEPIIEVNRAMYNEIPGVGTNKMIGEYVIKEIFFVDKTKSIYIGLGLLVTSIFCFVISGGMKSSVLH